MRIGVDVDGVLADFNARFIERIIGVTDRDLFPARPFDIPCWDYPQFYGYTEAENKAIWKNIESDPLFWASLPPLAGAIANLVHLTDRISDGDEVYFITSRPGIGPKQQTESWLRAHAFVVHHPTVLISSQKGLCAKALKLDKYIDDRWENVVDVSNTHLPTATYLQDQPWNRNEDSDAIGVRRVSSLMEIFD